jgi:DNA-binding NarL/FixJ family response regulator
MRPLRHAVQNHFKMAKHEAERTALVSVFDRIASALILVDSRGRVCTTNRAADRLLARRDGLVVKREGLRAASSTETETLRQLLAEAARTTAGRALPAAGALPLQRPSGLRPLHALITPIRAGAAWLGPDRPTAAIFVSDPEDVTDIPAELLRCFYRLTPAEAALGRAIARGSSLSEAAEQLGICRETARTRLKQVFGKTQTSRQAALVRLLLTSSAGLESEPTASAPRRRDPPDE